MECIRLIKRLIKALLLLCLARLGLGTASADPLVLAPFETTRPQKLSVPIGNEAFDPYQALHGTFSTEVQCATIPQALWVEWSGTGDCIRYYAHGLARGDNPEVIIYFGGDAMLRNSKGARFISGSYAKQSPATIAAEMEEWSRMAGRPTIYVARPGLYGSSGDHNQRRHRREIEVMNRSLDLLKQQFNVSSFMLVGQSAGGQIVAALLNQRVDISAAVISSGLVSVKQVANYWETRRAIPDSMIFDSKGFYDPLDEVGRINKDPGLQIYLISDPEDSVVPFSTQLRYVRALRAAGLQPNHIYANAVDRKRHVLVRHGRLTAALIAQGKKPKDVRRALHELDLEQMP